SINNELKAFQSTLNTFYGKPIEIFKDLSEKYAVQGVFCNRDYEPQAIKRDTEIYQFFSERNIPFKAFKDQVIFDRNDVLKNDGTPYTVYTPYSKKWKQLLTTESLSPYQIDTKNFFAQPFAEIHSLTDIGFKKTDITYERPKLD